MWNVEVQKILTFWWHWKKLFKFDHHPKKSSVKVLYWSIKFHPFFLVDRSKKINLHTRVICLCQNIGKWHGSNRRCTYFRVFFYILITLMRKIHCIKNCRFNMLRCAMVSLLVYDHCYKRIDVLNIWVIFLTVKLDSFIDR